MKKLILLTAVLLITISAFATHNMSGDITYTHLWGNAYRFTVRTFTNTCNTQADRCELVLHVGNDSITIPRINGTASTLCPTTHDGEMLSCSCVKYNIYQGDISVPGNGTYSFSVSDFNLNAGICNVPNSVNTPFSMYGEMVVNSAFGYNNTPIYTGDALIQNNVGVVSNYNPAIQNTEGDSLYFDFQLTGALTLPPASNSITIDHQTGAIVWDKPSMICNYIIDVSMKEYRNVGGTAYYMGTTMQEISTSNCSSALAVNENNNDDEIIISPNPCTSQLTIDNGKLIIKEIKIVNVLGKEIMHYDLGIRNEKSITVDMTGYAKGIYFVRIEDSTKNVVNRKIVVQ